MDTLIFRRFLFPYITGTIVTVDNYHYSAFQLESLNPAKSADLMIFFYFFIVLVFVILFFSYSKYIRIFNLIALTLGLVIVSFIGIEIFSDPGLKESVSLDQMTAKIGFGLIYQILMYILAVIYEFTEEKIFKAFNKPKKVE